MLLDPFSQKALLNAAILTEDNEHLRTLFNREFLSIEHIADRVAAETNTSIHQCLDVIFTDAFSSIIFNHILSSIHKNFKYSLASVMQEAQNYDTSNGTKTLPDIIGYLATPGVDPTSYNKDFFKDLKLRFIDNCIANCVLRIKEQNVSFELSQLKKLERLRRDYEISQDFTRHDPTVISKGVELYMNEARIASENDGLIGISYGYKDLDRATLGIKKNELIIVAGRPGDGKSTLLLNIMLSALGFDVTQRADCMIIRAPKNVLFFTIEMSAAEIWQRLISLMCHINLQCVLTGNVDMNDPNGAYSLRFKPFIDFLAEHLKIIDLGSENLDVRNIKNYYLDYIDNGFKADLIMVDYLQLLTFDDLSLKNPSARFQEIAQVSHYLKRMTKEYNIPIVAAAQLNRESDKTKDKNNENARKPRLSDLQGSSAIEQDANVILGLWRKDTYLPTDDEQKKKEKVPGVPIMYICMLKNRSGLLLDNQVIFHGEQCLFQDASAIDLSGVEQKNEGGSKNGLLY